MTLGGFQKFTLIDYPGKIAATVFTVGCNFRCPFCHNPELVETQPAIQTGKNFARYSDGQASLQEDLFFNFLKTRKGKLEGVCITGGEPCLQKDVLDFMKKIKDLGFLVKLDTNGMRPDILRQAMQDKVVDFIAMDIKHSLEKYDLASGVKVDKERIKLSVDLIRNSRLDYEFRTTVVPGIHEKKDFDKIGRWLKGSHAYALQKYRDNFKVLSPDFMRKIAPEAHPPMAERNKKELDLEEIKKKIEKYFDNVIVRE